MLNLSHQTRVFLFVEAVDMRKSFRGLCQLAEAALAEDPAVNGHWFVFLNRRGDRVKLLGWDGQGFWIWYKRLESGLFERPDARPEGDRRELEIDVTQLSLIIHGIDLKSAKRRTRYRQAS